MGVFECDVTPHHLLKNFFVFPHTKKKKNILSQSDDLLHIYSIIELSTPSKDLINFAINKQHTSSSQDHFLFSVKTKEMEEFTRPKLKFN